MRALPPELHSVSYIPAGGLGDIACVVVHFQGCSILCKGCWNPAALKAPKVEPTEDSLTRAKEIILMEYSSRVPPEGRALVVLSGGEPLDYQYLVALLERLRLAIPSMEFFLYSGYDISSPKAKDMLPRLVELGVTGYCIGAYKEELQLGSVWPATSSNQVVRLDERSSSEKMFGRRVPKATVRIGAGKTSTYGFSVGLHKTHEQE